MTVDPVLQPAHPSAEIERTGEGTAAEIADSLSMLRALSQETRLAVFRLLVKAGPDGLAAGEIARCLVAPQNTISTHLSILEDAGLLRSTRTGRTIAYAADLGSMSGLIRFLIEDCCQGLPGLDCTTRQTTTAT